MMALISRVRLFGSDLWLVADVVRRGLAEDPLLFIVQAARRLTQPTPPDSDNPTIWNAYRWFLADLPDEARRTLRRLPYRSARRRLTRRLAVQLGEPSVTSDTARVRAIGLNESGALSDAVSTAPAGSRLHRRLASELHILRSAQRSIEVTTSGNARSALMVLTNSLPYTQSGYSLRSHRLIRALRDEGVSVDVVTRLGYPVTIGRIGAPRTAVVDGVNYRRLPTRRLPVRMDERLRQQADDVENLVRSLHPGVLHCTTDYTNALVTREVANRTRLPWVYEMRGQLELTWIASRPRAFRPAAADSERVKLLRDKETELARDAAAVVVLSQVQADDLVGRGVDAGKISIAPNGIDPNLLTTQRPAGEARRVVGLPVEGFWVGAASSLVDYEGFDVLIDAVAQLRGDGRDIRCCIVGEGTSRPALMARAIELGIADYVAFPGRRPQREAAIWVQAVDVVVVPRKSTPVTRVVTPMKPIEAMALGRPVVASDLPALRETVDAPSVGAVFTPDDAQALAAVLERLMGDQSRRRDMVAAGRRIAADRTWQQSARTVRAVYESVCGA